MHKFTTMTCQMYSNNTHRHTGFAQEQQKRTQVKCTRRPIIRMFCGKLFGNEQAQKQKLKEAAHSK